MGRADPSHAARVHAALDAVRARCDVAARRQADPVAFVHAYADPVDQELVGLVAAALAFGKVATIRAKLRDLLDRVGPSPSRAADDPRALGVALRGWKHRVFRGADVAKLLAGARAVQRAHGSLGRCFEAELASRGDMRDALAAWCEAIRRAGGLRRGGKRRGPAHVLPDAHGASGNKRMMLYLRWMCRPADGVDLGLWNVDPARLFVPVDVHIHRLGRNLGLTRQRALGWRATAEITAALARFDPSDPAGYDFSLCHMGMLQRCPSRRDARLCEGCGVKAVCVHWARPRGGSDKVVQARE